MPWYRSELESESDPNQPRPWHHLQEPPPVAAAGAWVGPFSAFSDRIYPLISYASKQENIVQAVMLAWTAGPAVQPSSLVDR